GLVRRIEGSQSGVLLWPTSRGMGPDLGLVHREPGYLSALVGDVVRDRPGVFHWHDIGPGFWAVAGPVQYRQCDSRPVYQGRKLDAARDSGAYFRHVVWLGHLVQGS